MTGNFLAIATATMAIKAVIAIFLASMLDSSVSENVALALCICTNNDKKITT